MNKKVTVITATYNIIRDGRQDYFLQMLKSLQSQDYPNIEHLIIDGCSQDGSLDLFKRLNLTCISKKDSGIYEAFNNGIKQASGDYILFLNSDDLFARPDALSLSVQALEGQNADFTCAFAKVIDKDNHILFSRPVKWHHVFWGNPFVHQTMLIKKSVLQELGGFDATYKIAGDFDMMLRTFLSGYRGVTIPETLILFRNTGISCKQAELSVREKIAIIAKNYDLALEQAEFFLKGRFLPQSLLKRLIKRAPAIPNRAGVKMRWINRYRRFAYVLRKCFSG